MERMRRKWSVEIQNGLPYAVYLWLITAENEIYSVANQYLLALKIVFLRILFTIVVLRMRSLSRVWKP